MIDRNSSAAFDRLATGVPFAQQLKEALQSLKIRVKLEANSQFFYAIYVYSDVKKRWLLAGHIRKHATRFELSSLVQSDHIPRAKKIWYQFPEHKMFSSSSVGETKEEAVSYVMEEFLVRLEARAHQDKFSDELEEDLHEYFADFYALAQLLTE